MASSPKHYQEIQDNKINETLEAQLFKNIPENTASESTVNSGHVGIDTITENTYSNVISSSIATKPVKGFSYLADNNLASSMLKNVQNQSRNEGTGAIPKNLALHSRRNDILENVSESSPNQSNTRTSPDVKNSTSGKPQTIGINLPRQGHNFPTLQQGGNGELVKDNSARPQEIRIRENDIAQNKTPGRLRPEAFSFLKNIDENADGITVKNDDLLKRVQKNIISPTVLVHAAKLTNQNAPQNPQTSSSMETYEWSLPSPSNLSASDTTNNVFTRSQGDPSVTQNKNTLTQLDAKPAKPPLPSRPPPIFMYPAETFTSKIEKPLKGIKLDSPITNAGKSQPEQNASSPPSVLPQHNFIHSVVNLPSAFEDTRNMNEEKVNKKIGTSNSKPLPPTPTLTSDAAEMTDVSKENTDNLPTEKLPSGVRIFQWLQSPPLQVAELRREVKDFNHHDANNAEIVSRKFVATPIASVENAQFSQRKSLDSSVRADCGLNKDFTSQKIARFLSTPQQETPTEEKQRHKVNDFQKLRENTDPTTILDEIRMNAIHRPSLPQKLQPSQKSRSYNSLVQTIREMGFVIRMPNDKSKRSSSDLACEKSSKDAIPKKDDRKLPSRNLNEEDANIKVSKPQPMKNSVEIPSQKGSITHSAWFHNVDAKEAGRRLSSMKQDGAFLIRTSSHPTREQPYTACVSFGGRVINLHIRHLTNGYALGKHKEGENVFSSLSDMIKYHQDVPVEIRTASSASHPFFVRFLVTPPK